VRAPVPAVLATGVPFVRGDGGRRCSDRGFDVSPRFGTWDNEQVRLAQADTPWIKQVSATAEDGAVPQQQ